MAGNEFGTKKKPIGLRPAGPHNFKTKDGRVKANLVYYIHTYHTDRWEKYTTSEDTKLDRLLPFFTDGRIYIPEDATKRKSHNTDEMTII